MAYFSVPLAIYKYEFPIRPDSTARASQRFVLTVSFTFEVTMINDGN
jgi:hypothetical protein